MEYSTPKILINFMIAIEVLDQLCIRIRFKSETN